MLSIRALLSLAKEDPSKALDILYKDRVLEDEARNIYGEKFQDFVKTLLLSAITRTSNPAKIVSQVNEALAIEPQLMYDNQLLEEVDKYLAAAALRDPDLFLSAYSNSVVKDKLTLSKTINQSIRDGSFKVIECLLEGKTECAAKIYAGLQPGQVREIKEIVSSGLLLVNGKPVSFDRLDKELRLVYLLEKAREAPVNEAAELLEEAEKLASSLGYQDLVSEIRESLDSIKAEEILEELQNTSSLEEAEKLVEKAPKEYRKKLAEYLIASYVASHGAVTGKEAEKILDLARKYGIELSVKKPPPGVVSKALEDEARKALHRIMSGLEKGDPEAIEQTLRDYGDALRQIRVSIRTREGEREVSLYDLAETALELVRKPWHQYLAYIESSIGKPPSRETFYAILSLYNSLDKESEKLLRRAAELGLAPYLDKESLRQLAAYYGAALLRELLEKLSKASDYKEASRLINEIRGIARSIPVVDDKIAEIVSYAEASLGDLSDIECSLRALGILGSQRQESGPPGSGPGAASKPWLAGVE